MLLALGSINIWMGITGGDQSIDGGKNLLSFYFLYGLGFEIRQMLSYLGKIHIRSLY